MKIFVYEVREDEEIFLKQEADKVGVDIILSTEAVSVSNVDLAVGCQGISVLGIYKLDRELLQRFKDIGISYISTRTIGYNHIDIKAAEELGIKVCNAAYPPNGVADFTIMLMLMCLRNYKQAMWRGYVNDFSLNGLQGRDMNTMTVGVIGTGRIGRQVIQSLSGFGCRILANDFYENEEVKKTAEYVDRETIWKECDIITVHTPYTPDTRHMINHETIAKMKKGVILINCARGELFDINALVDGIESEKIGALGMDTLEGDQGIIHKDRRTDIISNRNWFYLHQFSNVIITQHMAFYTQQAVQSMVKYGIEGIVRMAEEGEYITRIC